jgi:glucose/mannose transport system substrate-binding protein
MRSAVLLALILGSAAAVPAAPKAAAAPVPVKVYHWWTSPSELAALSALGAVFEAQHPDMKANLVAGDAHGGGGRMFAFVRAAAAAKQPPDAFQVHAGSPLRPYYDAGLLGRVDEIWAEEGLEKVMPTIVRAMSQIDGHYYSVPMNVHRQNLVWYNKPLLDRHKIDPATLTTWDAFFKAAAKLQAAGVPPLQVGVDWTKSIVFTNIVASLGVPAYEDWINGKITSADDPRLLEALGILKTYLGYANKDHATLVWEAATKRVVEGKSAFCHMGDWANGEFHVAGKIYGQDYGVFPTPGNRGMYNLAIDGFSQTAGLAEVAGSNRWLRVASSRRGQDAFNVAKGSISARSDADVTKYDPYQKSALADFKGAILLPGLANATHDAFKAALDDVMARFGSDLDVKKAAAALAAAAARSEKKFTRVWSLK